MNQITPDHLARGAYVYVRQSTPDQLLHNPESRTHSTPWPSEHGNLAGLKWL